MNDAIPKDVKMPDQTMPSATAADQVWQRTARSEYLDPGQHYDRR